MNPIDPRLRIDLAAARYLEALERDDFAVMTALWQQAAKDPELGAAFREVHAGLSEEQADAAVAVAGSALAAAVDRHLPSAEVVRPPAELVTVADVADELFRHTPDRLPADAHRLNERLRASREPLPTDLGLSRLTAWAEQQFGTAPSEYWQAFRKAAIKLELRRAAVAEYQMAARPAPEARP